MAIFETGYAPVTSVGTISTIVFNACSVNTGSRDVTVINTGAGTVWVGGGSAAVGGLAGMTLVPGAQVTLQGPAITLWGVTNAGAGGANVTSTVQAGLATLASVV